MADTAPPTEKHPKNPHGIDDTDPIVFLSAGIDSTGEWVLYCQGQELPKNDSEPGSADVYMYGTKAVWLILPDPVGYTLEVTSSDKYNSATQKDPPFTSGEPPGTDDTSTEEGDNANSTDPTTNRWSHGTFTGTLTDAKDANSTFQLSHGYSYFKVKNWSGNKPGKKRYSDIAISFTATSTTDSTDISVCDPVFKIIIQRPA